MGGRPRHRRPLPVPGRLGSSQLQRRIGYPLWRRLHVVAFGAYGLAVLHTLVAGTDAGTPWGAGISAASLPIVGVLLTARLLAAGAAGRRAWPAIAAAGGTTFVVTLLVAERLHVG